MVPTKKVVWITGASSGIGEALAKEYSRLGAYVVLSARREHELERVRTELPHPDSAMCVPYDVTDFEKAQSTTAWVLAAVGHVDVLVNNAGIDYKDWVANTPLSIYQRVMDVNYHGNIALTLALLPFLGDGDQVVVITSVNGLLSDKCSSAYAAAKRALHGFYDALRAEQPGLRVSVVVPGYVRTPITVNSINGNGVAFGDLSEASLKGMPADAFASRTVRALDRGESLVVIADARERFAIWLHNLLPRGFYKIAATTAPEYENLNR